MDGFIKISAEENGIATEVRLNHFSKLDKLLLLDAFAQGLNMDDDELKKGLLMLPLVRGLLVDHEEGGDE
jgi:hypothetical protein